MTHDDTILRALESRRLAVAALVSSTEIADVPEPADDDDGEETLRAVMVRLWPSVRKGPRTPELLATYLDALFSLASRAGGDDWRYLDAWNNAYETLTTAADESQTLGSATERFLPAYLALLTRQCERMRPMVRASEEQSWPGS